MPELLRRVFDRLLNSRQMTIKNQNLEHILTVNLGIGDLKDQPAFNQILLYYIVQWPKLPEVMKGVRDVEQDNVHYEAYKTYIKTKIVNVIKFRQEIMKMPKKSCVDESVRTEERDVPFNIQIVDVLPFLKHEYVFKRKKNPWNYDLDLRKFINCPNVSVNVSLGCFCLSRYNIHIADKYLSRNAGSSVPYHRQGNHIEKLIDINSTELYTVETFQDFFQDFNTILGPNMTKTRKEFNIIIEEVLDDVRNHLDGKLYTNTSVMYELSNTNYLRHKSEDETSKYFEVFTPRMKTTFVHFYPNDESVGRFPLDVELENSITYGCILCDKNFSSFDFALNHFKSMHVAEDDFVCGICRQLVPLVELLSNKWIHCLST